MKVVSTRPAKFMIEDFSTEATTKSNNAMLSTKAIARDKQFVVGSLKGSCHNLEFVWGD